MNKFVGIDLHSNNNSVVVVSDEADRITCSAQLDTSRKQRVCGVHVRAVAW
jgi:hypothetical protein